MIKAILLFLFVILPIGLFLRNATYWMIRGRNIVAEKVTELMSLFHQRRHYRHHNEHSNNKDYGAEVQGRKRR